MQGFLWLKKAADLKEPSSLSGCGQCYVEGIGVAQNAPRGFVMVGRAAELGSKHACYLLGRHHELGQHGLDVDAEEARMWYRRMESCSVNYTSSSTDAQASQWLREHPA